MMVLAYLKDVPTILHLSYLFDVSESTINRHMNSWIPVLAKCLQVEITFPLLKQIQVLQNTLESDSRAIGSMDLSIHSLLSSEVCDGSVSYL